MHVAFYFVNKTVTLDCELKGYLKLPTLVEIIIIFQSGFEILKQINIGIYIGCVETLLKNEDR